MRSLAKTILLFAGVQFIIAGALFSAPKEKTLKIFFTSGTNGYVIACG